MLSRARRVEAASSSRRAIDASASRACSSASRRAVMSVRVPSIRTGVPRASRSTISPIDRIHVQPPEPVRWRNSTRYSGRRPAT